MEFNSKSHARETHASETSTTMKSYPQPNHQRARSFLRIRSIRRSRIYSFGNEICRRRFQRHCELSFSLTTETFVSLTDCSISMMEFNCMNCMAIVFAANEKNAFGAGMPKCAKCCITFRNIGCVLQCLFSFAKCDSSLPLNCICRNLGKH